MTNFTNCDKLVLHRNYAIATSKGATNKLLYDLRLTNHQSENLEKNLFLPFVVQVGQTFFALISLEYGISTSTGLKFPLRYFTPLVLNRPKSKSCLNRPKSKSCLF